MARVTRQHGTLMYVYDVQLSSVHQTEDGSWVAWATQVAAAVDRGGNAWQPPTGGCHIRRATRESLVAAIRSGAI